MQHFQRKDAKTFDSLNDGNSVQEVISQFDKGQLVVVKEDCDDLWYCGHVVDVYPEVTVRLPAGGSAFTWDQVCHCDDFSEDALSNVRGWNWLNENKNGEKMVMPPGLEDEDRFIYPTIRNRAAWWFVFATMISCAVGATAFNLGWLLLANQVNDGPGLQNYTWYALFFDTFYMTVKGFTFSSFLASFLPEPELGHKIYLYACQALLFPIVNLLFHAFWIASDSIDPENSWGMLKVSQPCSAFLSVAVGMTFCLLIEYGREDRAAACLRLVALVVILVAIMGGVVISHLYVFLHLAYHNGDFGMPKGTLTQGFMEILWVTVYTQGYITLLGKMLKYCLRLCDRCSPMSDIQRQRMIYVFEVVLEAQRVLYTREMLLLKPSWVAAFFVSKDLAYDAFHYGVKACPTYEAAVLMSFNPKNKLQCGILVRFFQERWKEWLSFLGMVYADLLELPKFLGTAFTWDVDTGYPGKSATKSIFFAETCVNVHKMPVALDQEFDGWAQSKKKLRIWDRHTKGLCFDDAHARNVMDEKTPEWGRSMEGFRDPGRAQFYRQLTIRIGGIIFNRYRANLGVKLSSSLILLLRVILIRMTPSKEVLNHVTDHQQPISPGALVLVVGFVLADLASWEFTGFLQFLQTRGTRAELFRLIRFARLFASNVFLFAVFCLHISLNNDLYITWANLKFGE